MIDQEHQQQQDLLRQLRASGDPSAIQQATELQKLYHDREMGKLCTDVYDAAEGKGHPPAGWTRLSEHPELIEEYAAQMHTSPQDLRHQLRPNESGFRAEIYLPDPSVLGPGYKPATLFKGSGHTIMVHDNQPYDTSREDFLANNFPQSIGLKTDYYDRAMQLALRMKTSGIDFETAGHSLGGGLAAAAAAVTGVDATTYNSAGLHPQTPLRFAQENPQVQVYDVTHRITAYQVQNELLTSGVQESLTELDVMQRHTLGLAIQQGADLLRSLPEGQTLLQQQLMKDLPVETQTAINTFVDTLAHGDTARMLRELPLSAGQVQTLPAMTERDGKLVARDDLPTLSTLTRNSAPLIETLAITMTAAEVGRKAGDVVAFAGETVHRTGQLTGQGMQQLGAVTGETLCVVTQTASQVAQTSQGLAGGTLAAGREAVGGVTATLVQGSMQQSAGDLYVTAGIMHLVGLHDQAKQIGETAGSISQAAVTGAEQIRRQAADQADGIRDISRNVQATTQHAGDVTCKAQIDVGTRAGALAGATVEGATQHIRDMALRAPTLGAATGSVVGIGASAIAELQPANLGRTHDAVKAFGQFGAAGTEALDRHGMRETVLPSSESKIQLAEQQARQGLSMPQPSTDKSASIDPATRDFLQRMDRMLDAAQRGDWGTFRQGQQAFANMEPGRAQHTQSVIAVDRQEQQVAQQHAAQQQEQAAAKVMTPQAPVMRR